MNCKARHSSFCVGAASLELLDVGRKDSLMKRNVIVAVFTALSVYIASAEVAIVDGIQWRYKIIKDGFAMVEGIAQSGTHAQSMKGCLRIPVVLNGNSVVAIGEGAFANYSSIDSLEIPNGVIAIGARAFWKCSSLSRVSVPPSLKYIGKQAFKQAFKFNEQTGVYIKSMEAWCNMRFESYTSNPLSNAGELYLDGKLIEDLRIPQGVTKLNAAAFSTNGHKQNPIRSVFIPDSVRSIEQSVFRGFGCCERIVFEGNAPANIDEKAFDGVNSTCTIYVPEGSTGWGVPIPGYLQGLRIEYLAKDSGNSSQSNDAAAKPINDTHIENDIGEEQMNYIKEQILKFNFGLRNLFVFHPYLESRIRSIKVKDPLWEVLSKKQQEKDWIGFLCEASESGKRDFSSKQSVDATIDYLRNRIFKVVIIFRDTSVYQRIGMFVYKPRQIGIDWIPIQGRDEDAANETQPVCRFVIGDGNAEGMIVMCRFSDNAPIFTDMDSLPYEEIKALWRKYNGLIKKMNAQCELGEMSNKQFKEGFINCVRQFRKEFVSIAMKVKWGQSRQEKSQSQPRKSTNRRREMLKFKGPTRVY